MTDSDGFRGVQHEQRALPTSNAAGGTPWVLLMFRTLRANQHLSEL